MLHLLLLLLLPLLHSTLPLLLLLRLAISPLLLLLLLLLFLNHPGHVPGNAAPSAVWQWVGRGAARAAQALCCRNAAGMALLRAGGAGVQGVLGVLTLQQPIEATTHQPFIMHVGYLRHIMHESVICIIIDRLYSQCCAALSPCCTPVWAARHAPERSAYNLTVLRCPGHESIITDRLYTQCCAALSACCTAVWAARHAPDWSAHNLTVLQFICPAEC